ncbi:MFS transporter [Chryseolinea sp. T2]|uniref:MFS transporter n=1 Tax=Chryseolinea sp. T2 TaxID=3129255 RepID=UPI003078285C
MNTISLSREQAQIHWKQLWSLAALYGSVVIGWIAYENYQPKLLEKFQFTQFALPLAITQGIILVLTPPLAGRLGDRYRFEKGHRLPIISSGISFAAMIFMAVAFTLLGEPGEIFKWVLPVLIVCWLVAMSLFTSPALSTLELFTPVDKLPRAMAILTIVSNLLYALEPVIVDLIDFLGAPLTFIAGGVAVFISGYFLKKHSLALFRVNDGREMETPVEVVPVTSKLPMIFCLGLAFGIPTTFLFNFLPSILVQQAADIIGSWDPKIVLVGLLLLSALFSLPVTSLTNRLGVSRSLGISIVVVALSAAFITGASISMVIVAMAILFMAAYTWLSVSSLPLAISLANAQNKVFCVGVFFSAVALPEAIIQAVQTWSAGQ